MKIQYKLTAVDITYLVWLNLRISLWRTASLGILSVLIAWNYCHDSEILGESRLPTGLFVLLTALVFFAGIFLVSLAATYLLSFFLLMRSENRKSTVITSEFFEDGFVIQNQCAKTEYKWDSIKKIIRTHRFMVLYVTPFHKVPIPRRAFSTVADWDAFSCFVSSHSGRQDPNQSAHTAA